MTWFQILGAVWLLLSLVTVICLMKINENKKWKRKKMRIAAFLMLASMATLVGIAFNSILSLLFYVLAIIFHFIATFFAVKINRKQTVEHFN